MPTEMVETMERFGGLHYANTKCLKLFALLEYSFSKTVTMHTLIRCTGDVLQNLFTTLSISNVQLVQMFADLCELKTGSVYDLSNTTICN